MTDKVKHISIDEYFKEVADSFSFEEIKNAKVIIGSSHNTTNEQCNKYNIKVCLVTYLKGAASGIVTMNPVVWAPTDYYISDDFYHKDDKNKDIPYRVFVGEID